MWINDNPKQRFRTMWRIVVGLIITFWLMVVLGVGYFYYNSQTTDLSTYQNDPCIMRIVKVDLELNSGEPISRNRIKEIQNYCQQLKETSNTRLEVIRTAPPFIVEVPEASK